MGRFGNDRGGFGGGRGRGRDFNGGGFSRGRPERRNEMHTVTCSKCGKEAQVPFKPTGNKPVFCDECFRSQANSHHGPNPVSTTQLDQINAKLDKIIMILKELELDVDDSEMDESEDEEDSEN